ncbi:MAG: hypothetical protein ABI454_10660 [Sphingomicrobium sp.]
MTIRVLLDASTTMIRSALRATLGECDDIELVENDRAGEQPADIDVVVVQQGLMREFPIPLQAIIDASEIGVVAIDDDGESGNLYRIYRSGWKFAPGGRSGLVDAIRAVAAAA